MGARIRIFPIAALWALAAALPASAQQGTLIGTVTNESGAPVETAQIQVVGSAGAPGVLTNAQGQYRVALQPGRYDLVVVRVGSRTQRVENVEILAGQTTTQNIVLPTMAEELDAVVVTASRGTPERRTETVATVHQVSSVQLAERPAQTLADHLFQAPGVDVITEGLQSTNVVVRGFNNIFSGALHMLTDHRLAGVPSLRVNLMHFIPSNEQDVERMEVVLGPGSALYGPNTANGVVHVLTKSPLDSEGTTVTLGGGMRTEGDASVPQAGSQGVFQGSFRSAWKLGDDFGFKVSGQYLKGDEWPYIDATEEDARRQSELDRPACMADKTVRGLDASQATIACERVGIRDFGIERIGAEVRADWRFAPDGTVVATYGRTDADGIELTGLGAGQTENWVYEFYQARLNKGRLFAQAYYNTSDAGDTYLLQSGLPLVDESSLFVGQIQYGADIFDGRQDFTYGFDYFGTRPETGGTINGLYEGEDDIDEWGIYLQSKTAITDQLDLVLAGRMDDHSLLADKVWSPRAALVFRPVEEHSVRLSYNRAFSTPSSLNYFLDISGGLAPSIGALGYSLRAFGTGPDGWSLQPDGVTRIRSPFIGGGTVLGPPPDAGLLWPAAVGVLQAQGAIDAATAAFLNSLTPTSADIGWMLTDTNTRAQQPLSGAVLPEVDPIQESYTETFEVGWTGIIANRMQVSADVYRMKKNDFVSPLIVQTPLLMLNGQDIGAFIGTPYGTVRIPQLMGQGLTFDQASAQVTAEVTALATGLATVPLGVVSSDSDQVGAQGADLIATYENVGDVTLWGGDLAFEWFITDDWALSGTYSYVSDDYFTIEDGSPIALNAPSNKGSVGLAYRNVGAGLTAGARFRFHDDFPALSAGYVGTLCIPDGPRGYFTEECVESAKIVDVNLAYRVPTTEATVQLVVNNVLDHGYRSFVGVPQVGRLAMLSVRYDLF